jgi:hypothetical protein
VIRALRRRKQLPWIVWWLLAWPLVFAAPHVLYNVILYYPRHIMGTYIAAAAAVLFIETRSIGRADAQPDGTPGDGARSRTSKRARAR